MLESACSLIILCLLGVLSCLMTGGGGDIEWDGASLRFSWVDFVSVELVELSDRRGSQ